LKAPDNNGVKLASVNGMEASQLTLVLSGPL